MISYLAPGAALTAAKWNDIFMAADALLTTSLGGASAVLLGADKPYDRGFFFFDPVTLPGGLHPLVAGFIGNGTTDGSYFGSVNSFTGRHLMQCRQYNDAAVASELAGLTVTSTSAKFGVALLTAPAWSSWLAAIYPSGFPQGMTLYTAYHLESLAAGAPSGLAYYNCFDVSLKVNTISVGGTPCAVTLQDVTTAEHAQPFKPIDIFINADFTWDSSWNKYSVVRVHNCSAAFAGVSVTFGSATATLPAGTSKCFRLLPNGWSVCGNYFHWLAGGDGRFLQMREGTGGAAAIFQPGIVADVLANVGAVNFGQYFDAAKFWDLSPVYNNSAYAPTANERTPPAGGYFPALSSSALLGDLIVHRGKFLVANRTFTPTRSQVDFTGFGSLATVLNAAGVNTRSLVQTVPGGLGGGTLNNLEIYYTPTGTAQELIDLSTPLVALLTSGNPITYVGASQTPASGHPPSVLLPWIQFGAVAVAGTTATSNVTYYNWATDGSGNPYRNDLVTLTLNTAGSTVTQRPKMFLPTDSLGTIQAWISSVSVAGGILRINSFNLASTPFGHVLTWEEIWPLNATFNGIFAAASPLFITKVVFEAGVGLHVTRARFLGDGSAIWPPRAPAASFMLWNFPRIDQRYTFQRFFYHDPADAPLMPDWHTSFGGTFGSHYSTVKYLTAPTSDDLSNNEYVHVQSFYETTPISTDTVLPAITVPKTGLARLGAFSPAADNWPLFAHWFNSQGDLTYHCAPDVTGGAATLSVTTSNLAATDWYNASFSSLIPSAACGIDIGHGVRPWANALPCQVEHYNLLASLVNAQPPRQFAPGRYGRTGFTLSFAAAHVVVIYGGANYQVGQAVNYNLKVAAVDALGAITALAQNGPVLTGSFDAYGTGVRPFDLGPSATGSGGAVDCTVGDGSGLTFVPAYNPVPVPLPAGSSGSYWPRGTFFAWNGATPGCADPVGDYLAGLGLTVQTSLPDGYGNAVSTVYGTLHNDGYSTTTGADYVQGFTPAFQTQARTYRWVTLDSARVLYAKLSLPLVLNQVLLPMAFHVVTGTLTRWDVQTLSAPVQQVISAVATFSGGGWTGDPRSPLGPEYGAGFPYPRPPQDGRDWVMSTWLNDLSFGNVVAAGFANDAGGSWVTAPATSYISSHPLTVNLFPDSQYGSEFHVNDAQPVYTPPEPNPGHVFGLGSAFGYGFKTTLDGRQVDSAVGAFGGDLETGSLWVHTKLTRTTNFAFNFGPLNPVVKYGSLTNPAAQAFLYLVENGPQTLVAALPQNLAYYDPAFISNNYRVYVNLGVSVVPWIVDNHLESAAAETTVFSGAGGAGRCEHVIKTGLTYAQLLAIPIDGAVVPNPAVAGAASASLGAAGSDDGGL